MVIWCRICGALMGIREPYTNWAVDRNAMCPLCADQEKIVELVGGASCVASRVTAARVPVEHGTQRMPVYAAPQA